MSETLWQRQKRFPLERPSLRLNQSPHSIASLLFNEVVESREAFQHLDAFRTEEDQYANARTDTMGRSDAIFNHIAASHEFVFELADVYIYSMSMAHALKRNDLKNDMLAYLTRPRRKLQEEPTGNIPGRISLLEEKARNMLSYIANTPDHEMSGEDEIFTESLLAIGQLTSSIAHEIFPMDFGLAVQAKIAYNEYRYDKQHFKYRGHTTRRLHIGTAVRDRFEAGRAIVKASEPTLLRSQDDFLRDLLAA